MEEPIFTVVILTLNEEKHIEECIKSIGDFGKVLIIDSFSTDRTVEIAKKLGAKVLQRKFTNYSEQRNYAFQFIDTPWVFFLDADERLTPELKKELIEKIKNDPDTVAYKVPRLNYYMGKPLKCWSPDYIIRVVKKGYGRWTRDVHEILEINGKIGTLKNRLIHYPFKDLKHQFEKNLRYAHIFANQRFKEGRKFYITDLILRPFLNFLKHYLLKRCFLEGIRGLIFSLFYLVYTVWKYAFLYELWHRNNGES